MKKRVLIFFSVFMLLFLCIPSVKAFAQGYAEDLDNGESVSKLETHLLSTGEDDEVLVAKTYRVYVPGTEKELVLPINFEQKGVLICSSGISDEYLNASADFYIYADEACTKAISYSPTNSTATIPEKGTYYLKFSINDSSETIPENYMVAFSSSFASGEDRSIKNNVWAFTGSGDTSKPIYYKITTTKPGSLTVNMESDRSTYLTLLNSSKKVLSDKTYYSPTDNKVCFAVAKGTYYLKVDSTSDLYRIKYSFKAISDTSGTSKAKAKKLTAGKAVAGLVTATDKKGAVDWYKITLTKSQEVNITFTGSVSSGNISLVLYGGDISGSVNENINDLDDDASFSATTLRSDKLPKGTYYIKIIKDSSITSGFYTLKLDK